MDTSHQKAEGAVKLETLANNPVPATSGSHPADFITSAELLRRIPICRKTLFSYRKAGKIPSVCLGGGKILFHVASVEAAILRLQRNGQ
jgi:hypothetical protein